MTTANESDLQYVPILPLSDLRSGERILFDVDDRPVAIFNVGGTIYAIEDACSHDDGPLGDGEVSGTEVVCPRHGARFDLKTGKALTLPAVKPILVYPTRIVDGMIEIGLPRIKD